MRRKNNGQKKCKNNLGFRFQTDRELQHRMPYIVTVRRDSKESIITDMAVAGVQCIKMKESKKIDIHAGMGIDII